MHSVAILAAYLMSTEKLTVSGNYISLIPHYSAIG